jgi:hypothetical protein
MGVLDTAINEIYLQVSSEVQKYPLGFTYTAFAGGNDPSVKKYVYVKAVSVLVAKGGVYSISRSTSADFTAITPTTTDVNAIYGVGLYPIAIGSYGFVQTQGNIATLNVSGATTINHALSVTANTATVTSEGSATVSGTTVAIATSTSATVVSAYLLGTQLASNSGTISINANWRLRPDANTLYTEYSTDNFATIAWASAQVAE